MAIKTVADVANFVIDTNKAYYGGFLFLIPQKILDKKINGRNVKKI